MTGCSPILESNDIAHQKYNFQKSKIYSQTVVPISTKTGKSTGITKVVLELVKNSRKLKSS